MVPTPSSLRERLERFLAAKLGALVHLSNFELMADGHAGLTFGFHVHDNCGGSRDFILKLAPNGVARRGSTDVYRQVPLLTALSRADLPVPRITWASAEGSELGAPFICMERLAGRTLVVWEPHTSFLERPEQIPNLWIQAARTLGALHRFPWRTLLPDWEQPVSLRSELDRWLKLLRHTEDPEWSRLAHALHDRLASAIPGEEPQGLIHGDFQPGNVLFDRDRLSGVIDWDLAAIGPQGIDVGWLLTTADRDCWEPGWKPEGPPPLARILEAYVAGGGTAVSHLGWYRAFAHFRFGSIAGLNLKLHRNGRRVDAAWERFAPSIRRLLLVAPRLIEDRDL